MRRRPTTRSTTKRAWLRWPSTVLPALLLIATAGLAGGSAAGSSPSSAPVVNITVTSAEVPATAP